jgi:hypothetical protein
MCMSVLWAKQVGPVYSIPCNQARSLTTHWSLTFDAHSFSKRKEWAIWARICYLQQSSPSSCCIQNARTEVSPAAPIRALWFRGQPVLAKTRARIHQRAGKQNYWSMTQALARAKTSSLSLCFSPTRTCSFQQARMSQPFSLKANTKRNKVGTNPLLRAALVKTWWSVQILRNTQQNYNH